MKIGPARCIRRPNRRTGVPELRGRSGLAGGPIDELCVLSRKPKATEAEHQARMEAAGRQPEWSLALNPTPALLAEHGPEALARLAGRGAPAPAELL